MGDPALIFPTEDIGINDNLPNEDIHSANSRSPCLKVEKKKVAPVKVLWRNQYIEEDTWEEKRT